MPLYKVAVMESVLRPGIYYVEANSAEEAAELAESGETIREEFQDITAAEIASRQVGAVAPADAPEQYENSIDVTVHKGFVDQKSLNFNDHRRAKNWIATVVFEPGSPGGLYRDFWSRGSGSYRQVPGISPGQVIEIAADYYTASGGKSEDRSYYKILAVEAAKIIITACDKPTA